MAGFKTHITTSTVIGIAGGAASKIYFGVPLETSLLAAGLCGVAGMMPDLDSGPGRPLRESMAFAAAVVPMMCVDRFKQAGMSLESMILASGGMYLAIRFGLAALLRRYTVHRGMFHSIPAALIAGEVTFLAFGCERLDLRFFVAGAVVVGFMSHLILDEIWSIEWHRGRMRFKSSFGTAIKFWGDSVWANISTYLKVVVLTFLVVNDQEWTGRFGSPSQQSQQLAERFFNRIGLQRNPTTKTLSIPEPKEEFQHVE
ncbi:MAG: metal-dependent hydrolase [Pirellulales bacterium]|nr:metal-dependent hydrolase [Pirellulales bacterium]